MNAFGNIFTSDNDDDGNRGCRVIWAMDGGHYGYHTPAAPGTGARTSRATSPSWWAPATVARRDTGLRRELLPREYFGSVLEADAGTRQVNFFPLTRKGAAFRTEYKVLLASDDPWFRPVEHAPPPMARSSSPTGTMPASAAMPSATRRPDGFSGSPQGEQEPEARVDFASVPGLIAALQSPTVATQDAARRGLIERGAMREVDPLRDCRER